MLYMCVCVCVLEPEQLNDGCEIVTLGDDEGMISEKYVTHMCMCVYVCMYVVR
jgi:hypothetical protein